MQSKWNGFSQLMGTKKATFDKYVKIIKGDDTMKQTKITKENPVEQTENKEEYDMGKKLYQNKSQISWGGGGKISLPTKDSTSKLILQE
jgi:hypothetical protein